MMRSWTLLFAALLVATPAVAQDSTAAAPRRAVLRDRIERNFLARAKEEMSLTEDQTTKLRATTQRTTERRRLLDVENRRLNARLAAQMRPGVAADPRVIRRSLDSLVTIRLATAEVYRDEQADLATYLSDVQRAQFHILRERFLARVEDIREQREDRAEAARRRP